MKSVLVTRPEPGATGTAEKLAGLGFKPLVLPLTTIKPLEVKALVGGHDAVAITSANALRHAPEELLAAIHHLPCFAVGEASAQIACARGFQNVLTGGGDGVSLAERINASTIEKARVLYLTGKVRSPHFEEIVERSGRSIMPVPIYDTVLKHYETDYLLRFFKSLPVDVCLLYSKRGAGALFATMGQAKARYLFEKTQFLCLSDTIASVVSSEGFRHVRAASAQDEAALLELLYA